MYSLQWQSEGCRMYLTVHMSFSRQLHSIRQLQSREYWDPNQNKNLERVDIKRDKAAGIRAQIWDRETRAGVQNLIGLMAIILVLTIKYPVLMLVLWAKSDLMWDYSSICSKDISLSLRMRSESFLLAMRKCSGSFRLFFLHVFSVPLLLQLS